MKAHSHVKKRRRGCLSGCLVKLLLVLGAAALLFVAACSFGVIRNDPQTGKPYITLEEFGLDSLKEMDLSSIKLPDIQLPTWPYRVNREGLTVKTLRAGSGEAVLVCSDGYTMLLGAGEGRGILLCGQMLLSGINRLDAAVAMQSSDEQIGGMAMALKGMKPAYLLYSDTQVKSSAYNAMMQAAKELDGIGTIAACQGLTFSLGRATVTLVGPAFQHHAENRDDGLSVRIDYGSTSVLVMGGVTGDAEQELMNAHTKDVDVLIASSGGSAQGTSTAFAEHVQPRIALLTAGNAANAVKVRLERTGAEVYSAAEYGVMTVFSDGQEIWIEP